MRGRVSRAGPAVEGTAAVAGLAEGGCAPRRFGVLAALLSDRAGVYSGRNPKAETGSREGVDDAP